MGPNILLALALCFLSLSLLTSAAPAIAFEEKKSPSHINDITVMTIAHATGNKCRGAPLPDQCRDAIQVAKILSAVFHKYHIITPGEKAALISLMAFETGDFMYNTDVSGVPGKGTRNMQSFSYNLKYAKSLPSAAPLLPYTQYTPKGVLDLLRASDIWDFGSAAWFLNTQCSNEVRLGLRTKGLVGWQSYITNCVGTEPTEARQEYWIRAAHAFAVNLD